MDIEANLKAYLGAREPTARYTSFDYCFNYFQSHRERGQHSEFGTKQNMQHSCLQLGFYLASWGMLRPSSVLLSRSVKHYAPVINVIASSRNDIWEIDADSYTEESCEVLLETARQIKAALPEGASDILVSKIMLGVFGCIPAFDKYFKKGFGASTFGRKALLRVAEFYRGNAEVIERFRVSTLDFDTGTATNRKYTRAKIIDMIFFVEGSA